MRRPLSNLVDYTIRPGDTLFDVTRRRYGRGGLWPKVARYNGLKRPDRLFAGQHLKLPTPDLLDKIVPPATLPVREFRPAPVVTFPAIQFELDKLMPVTAYVPPSIKITLSLKGELVLQQVGGIRDVTLTNLKKIGVKAKQESEFAMQTLTRDVGFSFDPEECKLDLTMGLASTLKTRDGTSFTHKLVVGLNSVKFVCEVQPAKAHWNGFDIEGTFGYEVVVENYTPPIPKLLYQYASNALDSLVEEARDAFRGGVHDGGFNPWAWVLVGVIVALVIVKAPVLALATIAFVVALEFLEHHQGPPET